MSKAADGFFVLATTLAGLCSAPFTGGLSLVAAGAVNVGTTGFFSVMTSMTRNEPFGSNMYRLGLRSVQTFSESFVPVWTEFNGFFTAIDDIRVGTSFDQVFTGLIKHQRRAIKVKPESLGRPVILSLLTERIDFLNSYIPEAKNLLINFSMSKSQQKFFENTMLKLLKARFKLEKHLLKSVFRYNYLLKRGKIPDHMLFDVQSHLKRYRMLRKRLQGKYPE